MLWYAVLQTDVRKWTYKEIALFFPQNQYNSTQASLKCATAADKGLRYFLIIIARSCMLSRNWDEDMGVHLKWSEAQARIGIYTTSEPSGSLQNPKDRRWGRYRDEMSLLETDTTKSKIKKYKDEWYSFIHIDYTFYHGYKEVWRKKE